MSCRQHRLGCARGCHADGPPESKRLKQVRQAVDELLDGHLADSLPDSPIDAPVDTRAGNTVATRDRQLGAAVTQ